ncbi:hypothetical protein RhiirA4_468445 [Rhizophagus irregularis]|uniref:Uncharacterized protein n=1 Tax=Rhizophagus irregularis TaxID=588596 RepID=A0A2I1GXQ5_9GLOM|nr:hypothetical protein RhiirA4_468445 [Rhizophagus irregularis]
MKQEKLREEHGGHSYSKQLSQEVVQQSRQSQRGRNNNVAKTINSENEIVSPEILKCSSLYQRKDIVSEQNSMIDPSSYVNFILRKRRERRQIRHANTYTLSLINSILKNSNRPLNVKLVTQDGILTHLLEKLDFKQVSNSRFLDTQNGRGRR